MELNTCGIRASSDVPTYRKTQNPIQIDTYIYSLSCKIISKNFPAVGCVWEKRFQVEVSVKILHVIYMTLK